MFQQFKGIFLMYLISYTYGKEVIGTVSIPTIDEEYIPPRELLVDYTGPTDCDYLPQVHITKLGDEVVIVKDVNNSNICNKHTLFMDTQHQFGNNTLEKRLPPIIGVSVTLLGYEAITISVGIATLGGLAAVGAAVALYWYTQSATTSTGDESVPGKRDYSRIYEYRRQDAGQLEVCYVDDPNNANTQPEVQSAHSMIQEATTSCVNQAVSANGATSIAPCKYQLTDSDGNTYDSVVIAGTTDGDSQIRADCVFESY